MKYPPIHKHECFRFLAAEWDIAKAWESIPDDKEAQEFPLEQVDQWYQSYLLEKEPEPQPDGSMRVYWSLIHIDKEKAMSDVVNLSIPVLAAQVLDPDTQEHLGFMIIDGWHRIYKAYHLRQPLTVFALTAEEQKGFKH